MNKIFCAFCASCAFLCLSSFFSTHEANSKHSRSLIPASRLKPHSHLLFVFHKLRGNPVIDVVESSRRTAGRKAIDRALTDLLSIDQDVKRSLRALFRIKCNDQRQRLGRLNRQLKRKPLLRTPPGAAHYAIYVRFFTLQIEGLLFFRIAGETRAIVVASSLCCRARAAFSSSIFLVQPSFV